MSCSFLPVMNPVLLVLHHRPRPKSESWRISGIRAKLIPDIRVSSFRFYSFDLMSLRLYIIQKTLYSFNLHGCGKCPKLSLSGSVVLFPNEGS